MYYIILVCWNAKYGFTSDKIFNVDESGFSTAHKRPHEIVAQKGNISMVVASGERGVDTTMFCAVSAAGVYILPMIIFKARKLNNAFEISGILRNRGLASIIMFFTSTTLFLLLLCFLLTLPSPLPLKVRI
jgi:hypothetical protein